MTQILAIAGTTLGEAIRRRVLLIILMVGLAFIIIMPGISELSARNSYDVLSNMTLGIIKITSAILAVTLTVYLLPNEIERRTIYTILSKPVQRAQFLLGKYLGSVSALVVMIGLMTIVLIAAFAIQLKTTDAKTLLPLVRQSVMLVFQMSLLAALALFFSTFATPVVNFFLTGLFFVFGNLMNPLFNQLGSGKAGPVVGTLMKAAHYVIPNFGNLDVQGGATAGEAQIRGSELVYMFNGAIYAIVYIGILMILSIFLFEKREV
ncbi:MAG: hypothetical protein AKCLJLPJ_00147 [Fimbriimonadales bacterium]|nr:MAG: ABC transporter permease [Armatimonadota bacterium]MBV6502104.1 hypothetical protein [Fimbriimonadales bacterium]MCE7898938.1 ABC transporter permease [Armatimonadetes bacterium ATM1]MDL1927393.1 ABC transporter permease [Fimbriimonadia bacterium ATM]MBC6969669.1 ABC transporter permease [Armatimonadota bacterium]